MFIISVTSGCHLPHYLGERFVVALWFGQEFDKISNSGPFCGLSINDKRGLGDRRAILITGSERIQEYFFKRIL